jgi:hypothetical protein
MDWIAMGAISSAIGAVAILLSLIFIWRQLREMNRTRQAEGFFRVVDYLQSEDIRTARRHLMNLEKPSFDDWTEEDMASAERVCNSYARIGRMIEEHMIPADFVIPAYHYSIKKCWEASQPIVTEYRRKTSSDRWQSFEWLYERTKRSYP